MYYLIYKITNQIDGKFYIGSHKTKNLNDNYMGSGKYLIRAQKKYGIENFKKEILFIFDNPKDMYEKEKEIVDEDFLVTENTYNLKVGGFGGFDYINSNPEKFLTEKRLSSLMTQEERLNRWKIKYESEESFRKKIKQNATKANQAMLRKNPMGVFFGKKHNTETIQKMKQSAMGRGVGEKNTQFGTIWITDGIISKKIKKTDIIPEGWNKGRNIKYFISGIE